MEPRCSSAFPSVPDTAGACEGTLAFGSDDVCARFGLLGPRDPGSSRGVGSGWSLGPPPPPSQRSLGGGPSSPTSRYTSHARPRLGAERAPGEQLRRAAGAPGGCRRRRRRRGTHASASGGRDRADGPQRSRGACAPIAVRPKPDPPATATLLASTRGRGPSGLCDAVASRAVHLASPWTRTPSGYHASRPTGLGVTADPERVGQSGMRLPRVAASPARGSYVTNTSSSSGHQHAPSTPALAGCRPWRSSAFRTYASSRGTGVGRRPAAA